VKKSRKASMFGILLEKIDGETLTTCWLFTFYKIGF